MMCFSGSLMAALCPETKEPLKEPASQSIDQATKLPVSQYDDFLIQKDATISFQPLTEELAKKLGAMEYYRRDSGFSKWLITFHEISGGHPYQVQMKREHRDDFANFETLKTCLSSDILNAKIERQPYKMIVSARGYLPGEELILRLVGKNKNVFKEIAFCPRPLVLRRSSGEVFAKVTLAVGSCICTSYNIECLGIDKKETFKFISSSAEEKMKQVLVGPVCMNYMPGVLGLLGGVGIVEMQLEDGSTHELKLPWGTEIFQYINGKK